MKFIIEKYLDIIDIKCKFPEEKEAYIAQLLGEVERIEKQNNAQFSKFTFSRTNDDGNIEYYQVICFDVFAILIKKVYNSEEILDVKLFYDEPKWVVY